MQFWEKYKHIKCSCGGTIGMYDRKDFSCNKCEKKYFLYEIQYDTCLINDKTGWMFPMIFSCEQKD
jgi:hypothetical protein